MLCLLACSLIRSAIRSIWSGRVHNILNRVLIANMDLYLNELHVICHNKFSILSRGQFGDAMSYLWSCLLLLPLARPLSVDVFWYCVLLYNRRTELTLAGWLWRSETRVCLNYKITGYKEGYREGRKRNHPFFLFGDYKELRYMVMFLGISRADKPGQSIIIINIALLYLRFTFSPWTVEWIFLILYNKSSSGYTQRKSVDDYIFVKWLCLNYFIFCIFSYVADVMIRGCMDGLWWLLAMMMMELSW